MRRPDARLHNQSCNYIRGLFEQAGITQRHFARIIGVNDRTVRNWLINESIPYSAQYCLEILAFNP